MPKDRGLLAEDKPVVGVAEALDPTEARPALRATPPNIARAAAALEGTVRRSHGIHRILSELLVELRVLFADGEGFTRMGPLEAFGFRPHDGLVPVAVAVREVEEDEFLLDLPFTNGSILVADLADVVIARSVGTSGVYGRLPFAVLFHLDFEDMDTSALWRLDVVEFNLERVEETAE